MAIAASGRVRAAARAIDRSRGAELAARGGLAARALFYVMLAYLALRIALLPPSATGSANAHGALETVAGSILGKIAIGAAAFGFAAFAVARTSAAVREPDCTWWQRCLTAAHGLIYLAITAVPISFLVGDHATGSERQQHHRTAQLLGFPGGQALAVALGVIIVGVCVWQIRAALADDHREDLKLTGTSAMTKRLVSVAGTIGTAARALVFLPIGGFLIVAAVRYDPTQADGLDGELLALAGHAWGTAVIVLAAAGLLAFAVYSALEARYRDVTKPA